jgi:integrase
MQPKERTIRRSVSILVSRGWLQLRFSYGGTRHYLSVGLRDTPTNRKIAEAKAKLIESDMVYERFDPTLQKYKPQTAMSVTTPVTPIPTPKTSLLDLWRKYAAFKDT